MTTPQIPLHTGHTLQTTAAEVIAGIDLTGKAALITGGHSGIGLATTRALAYAGATIILAARNPQKAAPLVADLKNISILPLDLADPSSIDAFSTQFLALHPTLHLLINNAGIMALPTLTLDPRGYELQFATNHLGHFQLTARLWPALLAAKNARVVNVSSLGHRYSGVHLDDPHFQNRPYEKFAAYGQSKTANIQFTVELDRRGKHLGIRAFSLHPGRILETNLARHLTPEDLKPFGITFENGIPKIPANLNFRTPQQGAATTVWCATSPLLNNQGGVYCANSDICQIVPPEDTSETGVRQYAIDPTLARSLWTASEQLTRTTWPTSVH